MFYSAETNVIIWETVGSLWFLAASVNDELKESIQMEGDGILFTLHVKLKPLVLRLWS